MATVEMPAVPLPPEQWSFLAWNILLHAHCRRREGNQAYALFGCVVCFGDGFGLIWSRLVREGNCCPTPILSHVESIVWDGRTDG